MPGIIDPENGYCVTGGALRYNDDFYFRHVLYERCPVRIVMENDAKCAACPDRVYQKAPGSAVFRLPVSDPAGGDRNMQIPE